MNLAECEHLPGCCHCCVPPHVLSRAHGARLCACCRPESLIAVRLGSRCSFTATAPKHRSSLSESWQRTGAGKTHCRYSWGSPPGTALPLTPRWARVVSRRVNGVM